MMPYDFSPAQVRYIQALIDWDDKVISHGQTVRGKRMFLDNAHIRRIHKATEDEIDKVISGETELEWIERDYPE